MFFSWLGQTILSLILYVDSVSSNTSTDEPLSSPFKDDKLDPNFEPPNSPLSTGDSDIEEAALNENRYQHKMLYIY